MLGHSRSCQPSLEGGKGWPSFDDENLFVKINLRRRIGHAIVIGRTLLSANGNSEDIIKNLILQLS